MILLRIICNENGTPTGAAATKKAVPKRIIRNEKGTATKKAFSKRRTRSYMEIWRERFVGNLALGIIALTVMMCVTRC